MSTARKNQYSQYDHDLSKMRYYMRMLAEEFHANISHQLIDERIEALKKYPLQVVENACQWLMSNRTEKWPPMPKLKEILDAIKIVNLKSYEESAVKIKKGMTVRRLSDGKEWKVCDGLCIWKHDGIPTYKDEEGKTRSVKNRIVATEHQIRSAVIKGAHVLIDAPVEFKYDIKAARAGKPQPKNPEILTDNLTGTQSGTFPGAHRTSEQLKLFDPDNTTRKPNTPPKFQDGYQGPFVIGHKSNNK